MIYITGDTHRDFTRFSVDNFHEQRNMTKDDIVIICGDFGGVWYGEQNKEETYWLDWLEEKPVTFIFVDGNHENHKALATEYPEKVWCGGKVHEIRPSVLHLMRGEVFEIQGRTFWAFGGASSHDISDGIIVPDENGKWRDQAKKWDKMGRYMYRVKNVSWWEEELPTEEEMENGKRNLEKYDWKVDFLISHTPGNAELAMIKWGNYKRDILTDYLAEITKNTSYRYHFFGHLHDNLQVDKKSMLLYEQIIRIV